ncbi:molecular chaperone [Clostridium sp. MF28]|uniref:molecular chaperone n=1 Tax=Clostridium TaxID=1485 RepID=UPI000CF9BA57|nr:MULTISPECIES: molecular chaperone [Clostridium]AVK48366.1 molecular chaperone [Clostridium sp. MF28]PSM56873.1 molecular chaperone [Clostridium diolis]
MSLYSYKLHKGNEEHIKKSKYKEKNLRLMTTFQLREICNKEKLVKSIINPLDKEELIRLIMKYRGEKESKLIKNYLVGGIERVERFLSRSNKEVISNRYIDYPGKITIYENLALEIYDNYVLRSSEKLEESNVLLVDSNYKVCTIFNIKKLIQNNKEEYFLTKGEYIEARESESKHYSLLFFSEKDSETIYDTYEGDNIEVDYNIKFTSLPILQFEVRPLKETKMPLAIDFGTSNTTAGIYIDKEIFPGLNENLTDNREYADYENDKVKFVKIINESKENLEITPLIPSIVGVKNIKEDEIEYAFGHDAMLEARRRYVDDGMSLFYDIKRWISDFEKSEKVIDVKNKTTFIKRKDIIKAYLEYIISLAQQRFKCKFKNIYISCPSKQKYKFHTLFKDVLSDYTVESSNILEESAAVLYNTISDLIEKKKYVQGEWYKALIIDCGGGTTDLTGCSFSISNSRVSYRLDIETSYENGDTDFGGNNLTFRILQLIKILMANALSNSKSELKKAIIDEFNIDIFRFIDKSGINELYETLNEEYEKAEAVIPTKFQIYETRSKEDYCKVRSNYYFLFDLAEEVKKLFFSNPDILKVLLTSKEDTNLDENIINFDKWKLSYMNKGTLQVVKEAPSITLSIYEIETLIKGDVYNIIKKFLEKLYENDELYDYSLIKLTGQSCKVDIFRDALKEFIPGRIIEINKSKKEVKEEYELKLSCLKGALKYLYDKNFGYADINIESKKPTLPYLLTAYTHAGEQKTLIKGREINKGFISRFMDRILLKLYLKDSNDNVKYEYNYQFNEEELEKTNARKIGERYPNINQHETDNIENNEVKFFVWEEEELWGFYVLAILRKEEELYIGQEKFFYFENDKWERNFFDGLK